ncbi:MAG: hypothetical protein KDB61_11225 [Planctomycetes bacterium]|nr:hypothetical protein [Planctomycetota bacterium]
MSHASLKALSVVALLCLASCGATQLASAKHKESIPTTVMLAVTSVAVEVSETPEPAPLDVHPSGWAHTSGDLEWDIPPVLPSSAIVVDLGVGEAPYDDGFLDYEMDFSPLVGFSDALMQLEYRTQIRPGASLFGIAAMNRVQDDSILQAMGQSDWAWFAMGVELSW